MEEVVAVMEVEEGEDILGEGQWWICWWILVILVDICGYIGDIGGYKWIYWEADQSKSSLFINDDAQ